jgi:hypothetical protein
MSEDKTMSSNYDNFNAWFKDILEVLYSNRNAGFAILMVALPLLERYLREKSGIHEGNYYDNNDNFYKELAVVFPDLKCVQDAKDFWQAYRNGLLHQVTISKKRKSNINISYVGVSHDLTTIVSKNWNYFLVNPVKLAKHVIEIIEKNFFAFEGHHSTLHPLSKTRQISPDILGTGASGS